jgi:hypothetical protein
LRELRLSGYCLFNAANERQFPDNADLYSLIEDGQKALAVSPMVAGLARG